MTFTGQESYDIRPGRGSAISEHNLTLVIAYKTVIEASGLVSCNKGPIHLQKLLQPSTANPGMLS